MLLIPAWKCGRSVAIRVGEIGDREATARKYSVSTLHFLPAFSIPTPLSIGASHSVETNGTCLPKLDL
jgi:hypothetical protein